RERRRHLFIFSSESGKFHGEYFDTFAHILKKNRTIMENNTLHYATVHHPGAAGKCPFIGGHLKKTAGGGKKNPDWWAKPLNLNILRAKSAVSDPMDKGFDYAAEFKKLDLNEVKKDITNVLTPSQAWWPADF